MPSKLSVFSGAYLKALGLRFVQSFTKHDVMTLSAALAFYTALSLAPLVLLVVAAVGLLGGDAQSKFLTQAKGLMGEQAGEALTLIVRNANQHPTGTGCRRCDWNINFIIFGQRRFWPVAIVAQRDLGG